eukprot:9044678-Pyramimonas_sp.AAC.1
MSNVRWPQARVHKYGYHGCCKCRICQEEAGSLFHRQYRRSAHAVLRRDMVSPQLASRAARV